jgi:putative ABC transport system permease protein
LTGAGRAAVRARLGQVTPSFFATFGIQPRLGRDFSADEDEPGRAVVILSDLLWRTYFNADPQLLGQTVGLDGKPRTVIGVMPPGFSSPEGADTDLWIPNALDAESALPARGMKMVSVIGRLERGVSVEQARANLELIARRMDNEYPKPWSGYHAAAKVRVVPLQHQLASESKTPIIVLVGAVGFILLIVCANVANLFLVRSIAREKEIVIRSALGASRLRLARFLFVEGLLIAVCGGILGTALMTWGISAVAFLMPKALPGPIPIDWRVLGFALVCSLATSMLFGLVPAFKGSRAELTNRLRDAGLPAGHRKSDARLRRSLVVVQLALSLILLAGAGLLIRSFLVLAGMNPGFDPNNVLLTEVSLAPRESYDVVRQTEFFTRALDSIRRIPGVHYAAVSSSTPLVPFNQVASGLHAEGEPESGETVCITSASAEYFPALRIPLLEGRLFSERDHAGSTRVVVINESLRRALFGKRSPLGHRIRFGDALHPWVTVIGVVADMRNRALDQNVYAELFQPYAQAPSHWMTFVIRGHADPSALAPSFRAAIQSVDSSQPLFNMELLKERLSNSLAQRRQRAILLGVFAAAALAIAAIGVYGVIAYSVARRRHEIGIRLALGARRQDILQMILGEGMRIALVAVPIGAAGAFALTRVLSSFLYGVEPTDPVTFALVCFVLIASAALASYLPARRASLGDPLIPLRQE